MRAPRPATLSLAMALLGATGCLDGAAFAPPFDEATAGTTAYLVGLDEGRPELFVFAGSSLPPVGLPTQGRVVAMHFDAPPEVLQLGPGRVQPIVDGPRPLPIPQSTLQADLGARPLRWTERTLDDRERARVSLPEVSAEACLAAGGCLGSEDGAATCTASCDLSPVMEVRAPAAPCHDGWSPAEGYCVPTRPPESPCPLGARFDLDTQACRPLAACPSDEFFEPPGVTGLVYVRENAAGGDGTRARPFGTLQAALQAPGGPPITLAAGRYAVGASTGLVDVERRVFGLCPEQTILEATETWPLVRARLDLARLRVMGVFAADVISVTTSTLTLDAVEILRDASVGVIAAGSRVSIVNSALRRQDTSLSHGVAIYGGTLDVQRTTSIGAGAVVVAEQGRAAVQDSLLYGTRGQPTYVLECHFCDQLDLRRLRVVGGAAGGVSALGAREVSVEDVAIWDIQGDGMRIVACHTEFHCGEMGDDCPPGCGELRPPYGHFQGQGLYVHGTESGVGVTFSGMRAKLEDAVIREVGNGGIEGIVGRGHLLQLEVDRAYIEGARGGGLHARGTFGEIEAHYRDVFVVGADRIRTEARPGINLEFATASLERIAVRDTIWHGIGIWCGATSLRDIDVRGAAGAGLMLRPQADSDMARLRLQDTAEYGLDIDGMHPLTSAVANCGGVPGDRRVVASDVRVIDGWGGLRSTGGAELEIEGFDVSASEVGLSLTNGSGAAFRSGRVRGPTTGALLPIGAPVTTYLDRVQLLDVETPLDVQ